MAEHVCVARVREYELVLRVQEWCGLGVKDLCGPENLRADSSVEVVDWEVEAEWGGEDIGIYYLPDLSRELEERTFGD